MFLSFLQLIKIIAEASITNKNVGKLLSIARNPFPAKNQTLRSHQSIYSAYQVGICSSYSNRTIGKLLLSRQIA